MGSWAPQPLLNAAGAMDPANGMILSRTYTGLSDTDAYRREAGTLEKVTHSVISVKGAATIASSERRASSTVDGSANSQKRQGLSSDAETVTDRRGETQWYLFTSLRCL